MAGIIWEDCEDIKLIELVSLGKYTFQEMTAWMSNRTASALQSRSSILGLQNNYQWHQYEFDKNFFETPNNRNCFWAGWLAADGNFENYCGERYALRWSIHQQDIEMMELFKSDIKFTGPITKFTKKLKTGVLSPHAVIRINQVDIQKYHLYKWGMIPNKTYRLPPSILETLELKLAFIVGYINGDGCINYYKSKKGKENFCIKFTNSSLQILQWIKQIAEKVGLNLAVSYTHLTLPTNREV